MSLNIMKVAIAAEGDVVRARQIARTIAGLLGYMGQDQTRIATAVSEIARNAFMYAGRGEVRFAIENRTAKPHLEVTVEDRGPGIADLKSVLEGSYVSGSGMGLGIRGARRLVDDSDMESVRGGGTTVRLRKYLPKRATPVTPQFVTEMARRLAAEIPHEPLAEMREQNRELIESLEELRARQEELTALNAELADTNRGVVALYAELDEKAEDLRRASDMKTRFLSNMTHELRTPINSILALSRIMQDRADGELTSEQERQVALIRKSAETLSEIINDLLDLAKVEAGKIDLKPVHFTASELLGALRGMFKPMLRSEVALVIEEPAEDIKLDTDQGKLAQILRNFISNALKFTMRGQVTVSAVRDAGAGLATFAVQDTGIGIAPEHLDYIFEEFAQVHSELQASVKGTGLGLPLSRRLAELLGGRVSVESAPGKGSMFSVTVPLVLPATRQTAPAAALSQAPVQGGRSSTVLIVDDDEAARYVMRQALRQFGGEVREVESAAEGLALASRLQPQLILMDLRMPGMDGFSMLDRLTADERTSSIPVVVVTSSEVTEAERSRLLRARAILSKADFSAEAIAAFVPREPRPDMHNQGG
jgi:signal transduction histidine kinase/ActR/RegA family two-component response regulator